MVKKRPRSASRPPPAPGPPRTPATARKSVSFGRAVVLRSPAAATHVAAPASLTPAKGGRPAKVRGGGRARWRPGFGQRADGPRGCSAAAPSRRVPDGARAAADDALFKHTGTLAQSVASDPRAPSVRPPPPPRVRRDLPPPSCELCAHPAGPRAQDGRRRGRRRARRGGRARGRDAGRRRGRAGCRRAAHGQERGGGRVARRLREGGSRPPFGVRPSFPALARPGGVTAITCVCQSRWSGVGRAPALSPQVWAARSGRAPLTPFPPLPPPWCSPGASPGPGHRRRRPRPRPRRPRGAPRSSGAALGLGAAWMLQRCAWRRVGAGDRAREPSWGGATCAPSPFAAQGGRPPPAGPV